MKPKINKNDYVWSSKLVIGLELRLKGGLIDSYGDKIYPSVYYKHGTDKSSGEIVIIPTTK